MSRYRVLISVLVAASLSACGAVEADPHRFERWGESVARIPVGADAAAPAAEGPVTSRPALQVEVLDVDEFWTVRDGALESGLRGAIDAAAPVVTRAVADQAGRYLAGDAPVAEATAAVTVQLGAFSTETAARAAWSRLSAEGGAALAGLSPSFERVERDGRELVRLRAGPVPAEHAQALCRAAGVADRWCASTGRS